MKSRLMILALGAAALGLSACGKEPAKDNSQLTLHEIMKNEVDKYADQLWDETNPAIGDAAGLDGSKMNDARWAQTIELATKVQDAAKKIAALDPIIAVKPGVKIADEDVPFGDSAASVQANIDKDPEGLRNFANTLADHMGDLIAAAKVKDTEKAGPLIDQLDGVCESCHLEFWYPSQKDLVEKIRAKGGDPELDPKKKK
jgi:cytochrome c556